MMHEMHCSTAWLKLSSRANVIAAQQRSRLRKFADEVADVLSFAAERPLFFCGPWRRASLAAASLPNVHIPRCRNRLRCSVFHAFSLPQSPSKPVAIEALSATFRHKQLELADAL